MYNLKVEISSPVDIPTCLAKPYLENELDEKTVSKIEARMLDSQVAVTQVYFLLKDSNLLSFIEGTSTVWDDEKKKIEEKYVPLDDNSFPVPIFNGDEHGFDVSLEARAETDIDSHTFTEELKSYLERQLLYPANLDTKIKRFFKKKGAFYIIDRILGLKRRRPSKVWVLINYKSSSSLVIDYKCLDNIDITIFGEYNSNL